MTKSRRTLLLGAYADGELSSSEAARVETMLREHADAATVVAKTQSLRAAVNQSMSAVAVPSGLRASVLDTIRTDRRTGRSRTIKLFVSAGFAAAAIVLLSVTVIGPNLLENETRVQRPALLTQKFQATRFAEIYFTCAAEHDELGVAGRTIASANRMLRTRSKLPVAGPELPDLSKKGLELVGACMCTTDSNVSLLHAAYQSNEDPEKHVGLFISDKPIRLVCGDTEVARLKEVGREYQLTKLRDGLVVVKWDARQSSVTLCSRMEPAEIVKLADSIDIVNTGTTLAVILLP